MEIIIVRYNNKEVEEKCIKSVKKHTDLVEHKLTVYDNYPENKNLAVLWNELIEASHEKVICLLNSDTIVSSGWTKMQDALKVKMVGAVGPITNNCGGIQKNLTKSEDIQEINDLSGFCFLFRKETWKEIGGFEERLPFYGQDSIFNRRLEDRGYKLMCDRRVYIHHEKASSFDAAKVRGELTNAEATWGAFHYWNYLDRLRILREAVPKEHKIAIIGGGIGNPFPLHRGIEEAVYEMFGDRGLVLSAADHNEDAIKKFEPDTLLCLQTGYNATMFNDIKFAKENGATTILYFNDLRCPKHDVWDLAYDMTLEEYFDYVFIGNEEFIDQWKEYMKVPNVYYMPQASIQHPKPPEGGHKYKHLHIGGFHSRYHQNRRAIFDELKDIPVTQLNAKGDGNNELRDERIRIQNESYGDYRASDFSWGISPLAKMYTSDRLYNIGCSGGCAIHLKPEGHEQCFEHGKHLYWFETADEARKIVENSTPEERQKIKDEAYVHFQKHHTYKMRLLNILTNVYTDDKTYHGYLNNLWKIGK